VIGLTGRDDRAALGKEAGFDYLVGSVGASLVPERGDAEFESRRKQLAALPLPVRACNVFLREPLRATGPDADHEAIAGYAQKVFRRAREAGVERIVFGSADARRVPKGFPPDRARAQFVALLKRLGPLAAAEGILVVPENLNRGECNFVNRVAELAPIVAEVDQPSIRMTADLYHMAREDEDPQALAAAIPWLAHVEIAEKAKRTVPGTLRDDFRPYFRELVRGGWHGWLNVEAAPATLDGYRSMFAYLEEQIRDARA
jgi:sugar phosphate isomerase/epimerase